MKCARSTRPRPWGPAVIVLVAGLFGAFCLEPGLVRTARAGGEPPPSEPTAITRLAFQGITPEVAGTLRASLVDVLKNKGFSVLRPDEFENRLVGESRLLGCTTPSCYSRLAQVLSVRRVIEGEVQRLELSTFSIRLQIRDLFTGRLSAPPVQERCNVCSNDDVRDMVARAAETLVQMAPAASPQSIEKATPTSGILVLESDPQNAEVIIDGQPRPERTPASFLLAPGVHDLRLQGPGYRPTRQQVEIPPGQQVPIKLVLSQLPKRRPWLTALSVIGAVGTVGLAIGTGVLFYMNGKPVVTADCPDKADVMFRCPQKYDNIGAGVGAAVGTGLLLAGTSIALYMDHAAPRRARVIDPTETTESAGTADPAPAATPEQQQPADPAAAPPAKGEPAAPAPGPAPAPPAQLQAPAPIQAAR